MQEAKINLGKVVRIARKRKRITQDYLAEKVGVQPRTILEIENGRGNPRFENLFVMVRLLDIAPNDIFNYDVSTAVFGETSAMANINGVPFIEVFLNAMIPVIQNSIEEQSSTVKKRNSNIKKYVK